MRFLWDGRQQSLRPQTAAVSSNISKARKDGRNARHDGVIARNSDPCSGLNSCLTKLPSADLRVGEPKIRRRRARAARAKETIPQHGGLPVSPRDSYHV